MRNSMLKALALLATLCLSAYSLATTYPLIVKDDLGHEITLNQAPQKIASLTLFTDEVLLDVLGADGLAIMTNLATDPTYSNITDRVPESALLTGLNAEVLISEYPDIIFAANWSDVGVVEQLRNAGLVVYLIDTPTTISGIQQKIRHLGQMLNHEVESEQVVAAMQAKLDLAMQTSTLHDLKALDYSTWGTASGVNTTFNAILSSAGLNNAAAGFEADAYGQIPMSKELIIELNPDVLFLPGFVWGDEEGASKFKQSIVNDPAFADVKAVQEGRIVQLPEPLRGTYSQYLADAVLYVVEQLQ